MSFLEKLFGKKEERVEEVPIKQSFNIEDAENFLSENFDENFQTFKRDANKIYKEMQPIVVNIQKNLKDLGKAEYKEKVDSQLLQNVIGHRKSFIQKMEVMLDKVKKPMETDLDSILDFNKSVVSAISDVNMKTVKDYHFLKVLFGREVQRTLENFKTLNKASDTLEKLVKENKENLFSIKNAQNELKSIKDEKKDLNQIEENLKNLDTKFSDFKSKHDTLTNDLKDINKSKDWDDLNQLSTRKEVTKKKISDLKSHMLQDTSRINKPLRKFKNLVDREVIKIKEENILEKSVDSILNTLIEEYPKSMRSILVMVQKNISNGKIKVKDEEKTIIEIKHILENNLFENFVKKYMLLKKELEELETKITIHKSLSVKKKLENQLEGVKEQIETVNIEIEKLKKKREKTKESIKDRKIVLERTLSALTNQKITIANL